MVASEVETVGKQWRYRLVKRRYLATFTTAKDRALLTYAAVCELGATKPARQVVSEDGIDWIKTQAVKHFPDALTILDWPHLWRKIRGLCVPCSPANMLLAEPGAKCTMSFGCLCPGKVSQHKLWRIYRTCAPHPGKYLPPLEDAFRYLETEKGWLGNSALWREQGYPVGSSLPQLC